MLFLLSALISLALAQEPFKIAIIDTGADLNDPRIAPHLCASGHKDFTGTGIKDTYGHGTHIAGIIIKNIKRADYCLVIVKYFTQTKEGFIIDSATKAIIYTVSLNPNVINMSFGGPLFEEEEYLALRSHPKIKYVVAAGNNSIDLDAEKRYPISYPIKNIIGVGNGSSKKTLNHRIVQKPIDGSNYGSDVTRWVSGHNILSYKIGKGEIRYSGSSMSTAIVSAQVADEMAK